jgi:hypothetical protein
MIFKILLENFDNTKLYVTTLLLRYSMLLYATLRYSTLLYATLRYSTLLYATLRYSKLLYATLRYSTLLYATLRYSTLRYSTLLYATIRYSTLLYATLLYATLRYSTLVSESLTNQRRNENGSNDANDSNFVLDLLHSYKVHTCKKLVGNQTIFFSHKIIFLYVSYLQRKHTSRYVMSKPSTSIKQATVILLLCCSSARQSPPLTEGIVAWRVISKQILLRP